MADTIKRSELEAMMQAVSALTSKVAELTGSAPVAQAQAAPLVTAQSVPVHDAKASNYDLLPDNAQIVVNGKVVATLDKKRYGTGNYGYYSPSFTVNGVDMQAANLFVHKNNR